MIQRPIRALDERFCELRRARAARLERRPHRRASDADRDGQALALPLDHGRREALAQAIGEDFGALGRALRQERQELLAAEATDHVGLAAMAAQYVSERAEHVIAREVTVGVVDLLEV